MSETVPRVSIGLAVFNGAAYLEQAIRSILAQTFTDFELIISDNASTDGSDAIAMRFAAQDSRVLFHRNAMNIGGAKNENRTFQLARGEYFRWAAHDDMLAPELLARCVEVLDRDPSVVLAYTTVVAINEHGERQGLVTRNNAASPHAYERFATIASSSDFCEETYGLIRSDILRKTRLQQDYTASDRTLLCELSLHGRFFEVQEPLFFKRFHPGNIYSDWRARMVWFDTNLEGKITFPFWMQFADYLVTIARVEELTPYERSRCYAYMLRWLTKYGKNMVKDVLVAGYMLAHTPEWRKARHASENRWT